MARNFLTGINLNKNELSNAAIQPLNEAPLNPVIGQIYFDTDLTTLRQWTGDAWIDYLNSADGSNYIESVDANFSVVDQELHLADSVSIDTALTIGGGNPPITGASPTDGTLTVKNAGNEPVFVADGYTGQVSFYSQDGNLKAHTEATNGAGAFRIVTTDDLALRATNGDIILYPGSENGASGKAFVGWGNAVGGRAGGVQGLENEITTAGNSQDLTNKTIADATVYGKTSFKDAVSGDTEYLSIEQSYTGTARFVAPDDISIRSTGGDIILYPGADDGGTGKAYIGWGDDNWGANPDREIATKGYVDSVAQGLSVIGSVNAGSIANVADLADVTVVGGVTLADNDRVLLKNQVTATENGIYVYDLATTTLTLSTNLEDTDLKQGSYVLVTEGTLAATGWIVTDYTAGASTWTQFSAANEYTAGTAIDITENAISVKYADGLTISEGGDLIVDHAGGVPFKYSENNDALTAVSGSVTWVVAHSLNTQDVVVQLRDLTSNSSVEVDVTYTSVDEVTLSWVSGNVSADLYRVTVIG